MGTFNEKALDGGGLQYLWGCLKALLADKADKTSIPTKFSQLINDAFSNVDNVKQYSEINPPPYPVNSVNGKTGTVVIDVPSSAADIGLGNVDNVKQYSASNPPPYPVTSVNGQTGAVTIDIPVPEDEIFWAVVDVTTNAEIEAAYEAGKLPCIKYEGVIYSTFTRYNATTHVFSYVHEAGLLQVGCMNGSWTSVGTRFLNMTEFTEMHNKLADRVGDLEDYNENIPAWTKTANKPSYTASEVGAAPASHSHTAAEVGALSTAGGTLTGNLTGHYMTATWFKMTADTALGSAPNEGVCVRNDGWIYTRTLDQLRGDIGAAKVTSGTSDLTAGSSALATGQVYLVYE